MGQLMTLLNGTLDARAKVLVKLNVDPRRLRRRAGRPPGGQVADGVEAPGDGGFAVETVVREAHDQHGSSRR